MTSGQWNVDLIPIRPSASMLEEKETEGEVEGIR